MKTKLPTCPKTVCVYRSNYGLPLSRWNRFINELWYHAVERNRLWAKLIYYPVTALERQYYKFCGLMDDRKKL